MLVRAALLLAVALSGADVAAQTAPGTAPQDHIVRHKTAAFGTVVEIIANVDSAPNAAPFEAAFEELKRIEVLVDEDDPRSAINKINAGAGGAAVPIDPELFFVLSELQRLAKLTKGAFDVTAAVYGAAWRFDDGAAPGRDPLVTEVDPGAATGAAVPRKSEVDKARALVGFDDLVLDPASRTARLKTKGARIGVRSVARGYALERAATVLEEKGITSFIVTAAGDLVVRGDKGERPWMVGIQDPRAAGHFAALPAVPSAVMTTGDYEEFFFDGGVRYHNVLDPRTGLPATKCRSVTVLAKDALTAEGLSRAVFVLGAKDGVALVERLKGVEAVVVTGDNKVVVSKGLKTALQHRPPTDGP